MSDLTIDFHGHRINLRVGAIVRDGDRVVLCRNRQETWWYLPGGRLRAGESSLDALRRELNEELGATFEIVRPLVCGENFFTFQGVAVHEVCFYYEVRWTGGSLRPDGPEAGEEFIWLPVCDVAARDLKPAFMKPYVAAPPATAQFVICREEAAG